MKIFVWLLLCLIWGTTWFFIKIGLEDLPPISFAALRFICALVIVFIIISIQKIQLPKTKSDWKLVGITGFLQFSFNYAAVFWSEVHISSGLAAVLQATIPAFGLLAAWIHLKHEKIGWRKISAILLGIAGVAIIFIEQLQVSSLMGFLGCLAIVCGAAAAAEASILTKAFGSSLHPASLVFGQMLCGILPLILFGLWQEGNPLKFHWTTRAIISVLYLAIIGTIIAFWLYYWLLSKIESTKAMTISLITPLVAVVIGALALGEKLPLQTFLGGLLILASIGIIILRSKKQTQVIHLTAEN
jgi:drug/metabolite transporter (DMT)-like permease